MIRSYAADLQACMTHINMSNNDRWEESKHVTAYLPYLPHAVFPFNILRMSCVNKQADKMKINKTKILKSKKK